MTPRCSRTTHAPSAVSTELAARVARSSDQDRLISTTDDAEALREVLGVQDLDPELLRHALTHRSYAYENGGVPNNERLEFLGDSVLGLVVTDALFTGHPHLPEGQLAKLRAAVVSAKALADVARTLGLGEHVRLGRGEQATGGRDKASILSDTLEAVLGAIYVQFGIERASEVIHRVFDPVIAVAAELGAGLDWKTSLQEISSNTDMGVPQYVLVGTGPDHDKSFTAEVIVGNTVFTGGAGRSKKEAEQMVAEIAWRSIHATLDPVKAAESARSVGRAQAERSVQPVQAVQADQAPAEPQSGSES